MLCSESGHTGPSLRKLQCNLIVSLQGAKAVQSETLGETRKSETREEEEKKCKKKSNTSSLKRSMSEMVGGLVGGLVGGESDALWVNISQTSGVTAGRKAEWKSVASHTAQLEEGDGGFRKFIWENWEFPLHGTVLATGRGGRGRRRRRGQTR